MVINEELGLEHMLNEASSLKWVFVLSISVCVFDPLGLI